MTDVWEGARLLFRGIGWEQLPDYVQDLFEDARTAAEDEPYVLRIDTHARSGDFADLVTRQIPDVQKAAAGRKIWWLNDRNGEWHDVWFVFGDLVDLDCHLSSLPKDGGE